MENDIETIVKNKKAIDLRTNDNKRKRIFIPFDFYGQGLKLGLVAGIGMAMVLFALQYLGMNESVGWKFLKYIILGAVLTYGLVSQKKYQAESYQFKRGILFGLFITAFSAIVLAAINLFAFTFTDSMAFDKFSMEASNAGNFAVITGIVFFEALVYGMILTFIVLQFIKTKKRPV